MFETVESIIRKRGDPMRIISFLGMLLAVAGVALPARAFDFADARKLVSVSAPQISPDGTRVVYLRATADFERDRTTRQLMLLDVRTRRERALTFERRGVAGPQWSPNGSAVAFLALDADEKNPQEQIFILRMDGGEARQVTHAKNGVNAFAWSPDAKHFAYA